ncbi:MAG: PDZ domain-containing protein [Phycisphaerae bacterium]|nr:PDZ domain-containing protein [Phycisphaerae bacterium]
MLSKGEITAACVTGVVLGAMAGGCVVVIDGQDDHWSWSESSAPKRPKLGVYLDEPGRTIATQLNINRRESTVITDVFRDSAAERAGLREYDIVTRIDGSDQAGPSDLRRAIRSKSWGDAMTLTVIREGQPMDVVVTFDLPESKEAPKY